MPTAAERQTAVKGKHRQHYEAEARRKKVLELVAGGMMVKDAVAEVGVSYNTYEKWRSRYKAWGAQVDAARIKRSDPLPEDVNGMEMRPLARGFDLAMERKRWFGHDTPAFQLEMIQALMDTPPGNILMVLLPPEHDKTTVYEGFKSLDIAYNPHGLNHIASETQTLSKKILGKIKRRLEGNGPMAAFVNTYGPFSPQSGDGSRTQPWTATHFDVWSKGDYDDRDYTLAALGFGSQIIGSRSHHLHCDDLQSMKTLSQTEDMLDEFRQDWLSRPGEQGITTIFGNRVDEGDIYGAIEEAFDPDILHIIRYPAIHPDGTPLWPERWPLEKLDRMKRKVVGRGSDDRWERNWMQRPRPKGSMTFTEELVDATLNPQISLNHPKASEGKFAYLALDPAIGGRTAVVVLQVTHAGRIRPVHLRDVPGLTSNEAIMRECHLAILWAERAGFTITDWVIEAKNFQAGLARDERLQALSQDYGIVTREHLTGWNKYDDNIGVASMATTFVKGEIELPWAPDNETRSAIGELRRQLLAWRPATGGGGRASARGNKLRQDLVMALWFGWIRWRQVGKKEAGRETASQFKGRGLPYAQTPGGLILPNGYTPTILGAAS